MEIVKQTYTLSEVLNAASFRIKSNPNKYVLHRVNAANEIELRAWHNANYTEPIGFVKVKAPGRFTATMKVFGLPFTYSFTLAQIAAITPKES